MTSFDAGDVVEVPFPFVDRPVRKRRPALVLAVPQSAHDVEVAVLAMITSARRSAWPSDVPISDVNVAGLNGPSVIRWKIFTIETITILRTRGRLSERDFAAVGDRLRDLLGDWWTGR